MRGWRNSPHRNCLAKLFDKCRTPQTDQGQWTGISIRYVTESDMALASGFGEDKVRSSFATISLKVSGVYIGEYSHLPTVVTIDL